MRWLVLAALVACGGSKEPVLDGTGGPAITVTATVPGASPETVEATLVTPLEQALARAPGVVTLRSVSAPGEARVVLWFAPGTDELVAAQVAREAVTAVRSQLPRESEHPQISLGDPDAPPDLAFVVRSDAQTAGDVTKLLEETVAPALRQTPGTRRVEVTGGRPLHIRIEIDPERVRQTGVTHDEVIAALTAAPSVSVEDAGSLVVAQLSHVPVLVRDLATFRVEPATPPTDGPVGLAIWLQASGRRSELEATLREATPTIAFEPTPPPAPRPELAVELVGNDLDALAAVADSLTSDLADVAILRREPPASADRVPQLAIDRADAARLGVPAIALDGLAAAIAHQPVRGRTRVEDLAVLVDLGPSLEAILVRASDGAAIPLSMFATLAPRPVTPIVHVNARRALVLAVELRPGGSAADVQRLLDRHPRIAHDRKSSDPFARLVRRKRPQ